MKNILILSLLSLIITGCKIDTNTSIVDIESIRTNTQTNTKIALICNLTKVDKNKYDGWDGNCPGTDVDAKNFAKFCSDNNIPYIKLENEQCTCKEIITKWTQCVSTLNPTNGLFIFYYSGHGGQHYSFSESDRRDETLCFYDGEMLDNTVWELISIVPRKSRVFFVTDCCNSGTNYQLPFTFKTKRSFSRSQEPNMLHYGGCGDGQSSYGYAFGGAFTLALKKYYDKNLTYKEWFDKCEKELNRGTSLSQKPTFAETGISFKDTKIFQ